MPNQCQKERHEQRMASPGFLETLQLFPKTGIKMKHKLHRIIPLWSLLVDVVDPNKRRAIVSKLYGMSVLLLSFIISFYY